MTHHIFNNIINMVVIGEHSPYHEMMQKTKDIDIDFFEKVFRGIYTLSEELNLELKDKVLDVFSKIADSYYIESDLESNLIDMIQKEADAIKVESGTSGCRAFLDDLAKRLEEYTSNSNLYVGLPNYSNADVKALYEDAKHITLVEFFMGSNDQDILRFYEALMDNTWWACREMVANRTVDFLLKLAGKVRGIETK